LNSLPFWTWFGLIHGQVAHDLLSNLGRVSLAISQSFLQKQESRLFLKTFWIPACAGMTDPQLFPDSNLDKTDHGYSIFLWNKTKEYDNFI